MNLTMESPPCIERWDATQGTCLKTRLRHDEVRGRSEGRKSMKTSSCFQEGTVSFS